MLFRLYLHTVCMCDVRTCTKHMARRKTASCHAKATTGLALVEAAAASEKPLATFQVERGLHQTPVSFLSRAHAAECIHLHNYLHTSGIHTTLASDMQPRSHPSPPRITRCLFVRCWSYRHTAPHSTRPGSAQVHNATNRDYHGDASANGCFSPRAQ